MYFQKRTNITYGKRSRKLRDTADRDLENGTLATNRRNPTPVKPERDATVPSTRPSLTKLSSNEKKKTSRSNGTAPANGMRRPVDPSSSPVSSRLADLSMSPEPSRPSARSPKQPSARGKNTSLMTTAVTASCESLSVDDDEPSPPKRRSLENRLIRPVQRSKRDVYEMSESEHSFDSDDGIGLRLREKEITDRVAVGAVRKTKTLLPKGMVVDLTADNQKRQVKRTGSNHPIRDSQSSETIKMNNNRTLSPEMDVDGEEYQTEEQTLSESAKHAKHSKHLADNPSSSMSLSSNSTSKAKKTSIAVHCLAGRTGSRQTTKVKDRIQKPIPSASENQDSVVNNIAAPNKIALRRAPSINADIWQPMEDIRTNVPETSTSSPKKRVVSGLKGRATGSPTSVNRVSERLTIVPPSGDDDVSITMISHSTSERQYANRSPTRTDMSPGVNAHRRRSSNTMFTSKGGKSLSATPQRVRVNCTTEKEANESDDDVVKPDAMSRTYSTSRRGAGGTYAVTYGKSRSFAGQSSSCGDMPASLEQTLSQSSIRINSKFLEDDEPSADITRREVKAAHEVREAGKNSRFTDDMEYLYDGITDSQSVALQRSSGIEFARRMLSRGFVKDFRAHDQIPRIYQLLSPLTDPIIMACLAFILASLLQNRRNVDPLLSAVPDFKRPLAAVVGGKSGDVNGAAMQMPTGKNCVRWLVDAIATVTSDPFSSIGRPRRRKQEAQSIIELQDIIIQSNLITERDEISIARLTLISLGMLISDPESMEARSVTKKLRATEGAVTAVTCAVVDWIKDDMRRQVDSSANGEEITRSMNFAGISRAIQIIEQASMLCHASQISALSVVDLVEQLMSFMASSYVEYMAKSERSRAAAQLGLPAVLRTLINLTHENPDSCTKVSSCRFLGLLLKIAVCSCRLAADQDSIRAEIDVADEEGNSGDETTPRSAISANLPFSADDGEAFDIALLSIGLLINLAHSEESNRAELFGKIEVSPDCPGTSKCLYECECSSRQGNSAIRCLTDACVHWMARGAQTEDNVMAGYLAMLLGCLCTHPGNRIEIADRLPGRSFADLATLLDEFIMFSQHVGDVRAEETGAFVAEEGDETDSNGEAERSEGSDGLEDRRPGDLAVEAFVRALDAEAERNGPRPSEARVHESFTAVVALLRSIEGTV